MLYDGVLWTRLCSVVLLDLVALGKDSDEKSMRFQGCLIMMHCRSATKAGTRRGSLARLQMLIFRAVLKEWWWRRRREARHQISGAGEKRVRQGSASSTLKMPHYAFPKWQSCQMYAYKLSSFSPI